MKARLLVCLFYLSMLLLTSQCANAQESSTNSNTTGTDISHSDATDFIPRTLLPTLLDKAKNLRFPSPDQNVENSTKQNESVQSDQNPGTATTKTNDISPKTTYNKSKGTKSSRTKVDHPRQVQSNFRGYYAPQVLISPMKNDVVYTPVGTGEIISKAGTFINPTTGKKGFHSGVDLAANLNDKVYNLLPGIVTRVGWRGNLGVAVEIYHPYPNIRTIYGHLNAYSVRPGMWVERGRVIGYAGSTGRSTGVYLYYTVIRHDTNQYIEPILFLKQVPKYVVQLAKATASVPSSKSTTTLNTTSKQTNPIAPSKTNIPSLARAGIVRNPLFWIAVIFLIYWVLTTMLSYMRKIAGILFRVLHRPFSRSNKLDGITNANQKTPVTKTPLEQATSYQASTQEHQKPIVISQDKAADFDSALAYSKEGKHQKAIDCYSKHISLNPHHSSAYFNRGNEYAELRAYQKAINDYNKVIELDPNYSMAYCYRGEEFAKLKDYQKAIDDYNQAIRLDPECARAYNNRGLAYAKLGKQEKFLDDYSQEKAIGDYNQAIQLDPKYLPAYAFRGQAYKELGKIEKAEIDFAKAAQLASEFSDTPDLETQANFDDNNESVLVEQPSNNGPSEVDKVLSQKIELRAIELVKKYEQKQGRTVEDKSMYYVGYDLKSTIGNESKFVEVKGKSANGAIVMTAHEWDVAMSMGESYFLYIVENVFEKLPTLKIIQNPYKCLKAQTYKVQYVLPRENYIASSEVVTIQ